jgi:hypothetical protein
VTFNSFPISATDDRWHPVNIRDPSIGINQLAAGFGGKNFSANVVANKNGVEITLNQPVNISAAEAVKVVLR